LIFWAGGGVSFLGAAWIKNQRLAETSIKSNRDNSASFFINSPSRFDLKWFGKGCQVRPESTTSEKLISLKNLQCPRPCVKKIRVQEGKETLRTLQIPGAKIYENAGLGMGKPF